MQQNYPCSALTPFTGRQVGHPACEYLASATLTGSPFETQPNLE